MKIILANPRGFCAGVDRAVEIVSKALVQFKPPVYVRHEVVHNKFVVDCLRREGAVFVEELNEVPDDSTVIFSAHGVSQAVRDEADKRGLNVLDATCPLVTKVHMEVIRHARAGRECILIGHAGHPEVEGTMGQYKNKTGGMYLVETPADVEKLQVNDPDNLAFVTQTTLSVDDTNDVMDALRKRFPNIVGPKKDDICYATQNRQDAVKALAQKSDLVLVVGSPNSSNSNRLKEVAERAGKQARLIDNASYIEKGWLEGCETIGITAGASAPEILVQEVIEKLKEYGAEITEEDDGQRENVVFTLPKVLQS
ncbi:MAG: 4-hydroxy-3-methylbut-2-enyl diphosphate reductase [Gammaproteobacteria bacterium]|nr:4-hydroxy-3-methylbut-2-enyl diphosphate reductase [Gammaproteobacteria bacterium]MDH5594148.1 4-hydroxy-3-methylbut-2-enyl diphosphate reductase [Gammaproteobacteria bacterium]